MRVAGAMLGAVLAVVHQRCAHCGELCAFQVIRVYGRDVFGKVARLGLMQVTADDHECPMRKPWRRRLTGEHSAGDEARANEGDTT